MEFTNTRRGFFQESGTANDELSSLTLPVQTALPPLRLVKPSYFFMPIASRRAASLIA
jgi:hypothetical protein